MFVFNAETRDKNQNKPENNTSDARTGHFCFHQLDERDLDFWRWACARSNVLQKEEKYIHEIRQPNLSRKSSRDLFLVKMITRISKWDAQQAARVSPILGILFHSSSRFWTCVCL